MGNESNTSKPEVDALIEEIRQAARLQRALPASGRAEGTASASLARPSGLLDGYLAELVRRSHPRTELPLRFRRFPLTIAPVRGIALRVYNLLTREQRANNILLRDALQALQATLNRNELALRESALLTNYVRAMLLQGRSGRAPGERAGTFPQNENEIASVAETDSFFAALGDEFRGSPELIKDRLRVYQPRIRAAALTGPALDLGCGRGEWLELMREAEIESIGVEQNQMLAAACRAKNLHVIEADFVAFLEQSPPEHWRIVTGFHVIEHLGWPAWYDCLRHIHRALGPEGMVILETPNPANLLTAANFFYLDPTHRHPLPDSLLAFAAKSVGFASIEILPLHPFIAHAAGIDAGLEAESGESAIVRAMTGPQDYALIARK
jgi:2-polyprenyl-3-methyl-5-hydroxy-6-metoxy-1,4-benzoquinol methylase